MRMIMVGPLAAGLVLAPALASTPPAATTAAALAVIKRFQAAETPAAYAGFCRDDTLIIDHVPPYVFRGPGACRRHWDAVLAWVRHEGITVQDYASIGELLFADQQGDRLYLVVSATAAFVQAGQSKRERANWTYVMRRQGKGWRIESSAWAVLGFDDVAAAQPQR